ncbi:MAG TPA: SMC-Scp complex subunit ScpB [Chloroflexota bacterium]|nr:SMC-Scp complex subunit ScpB [Chloroflexota bacterium]
MRNEPAESVLSALESILLVAPGPVPLSALVSALGLPRRDIEAALAALAAELRRGIRLQSHAGTLRLVSAPENAEVVRRFLGTVRPPSLSRAALEVLAVVAYDQPATRAEVEAARGLDSDRPMRTLIARGLIEEVGRRAGPGRPAEYGTTAEFLEYFGLTSLDDLPPRPEPETATPEELGFRPQ